MLGFKFTIALEMVEITFSFSVDYKGEIMDLLKNFQWGVLRGYPGGLLAELKLSP